MYIDNLSSIELSKHKVSSPHLSAIARIRTVQISPHFAAIPLQYSVDQQFPKFPKNPPTTKECGEKKREAAGRCRSLTE
jgi:hypothetical protein